MPGDRSISGNSRSAEATLERDVVVVGGGPAGSAAAALLAEAGYRVLLVDRARFPRSKPCAEYASPGVEPLLERLGLRDHVGRSFGRRLRGMELVAPGGGRFLVEYRLDGRSRFGFALPRLQFDAALLAAARARGVEVWEAFRVTSLVLDESGVRGVIGDDAAGRAMQVLASLVIGADGLHSIVARRLSLPVPVRWPRRLGLVAHFQGVPWPEDYGRMQVGRRGYVGVAPLGDSQLVVGLVRSMPTERLGSADGALSVALSDYPDLVARLGSGQRVGPVQGVGPLARAVRSYSGSGYLLVGDAAGFLDPFTGEGIYRALRSAELAARVADAALRAGDVSARRLREYDVLRARELAAKERLTRMVQLFVYVPALMDYALERLKRRKEQAAALSLALGDLALAEQVLRPGTVWQLLKP